MRPIRMASTGVWSFAPEAAGLGPRSRGPVADGLWTKDDTGLASGARRRVRGGRGEVGGIAASACEIMHTATRAAREGPGCKGRRPTSGSQADRPAIARHGRHPGRGDDSLMRPRTVSYSPLGNGVCYLRKQPRPDHHAGLLALGDSLYERAE